VQSVEYAQQKNVSLCETIAKFAAASAS